VGWVKGSFFKQRRFVDDEDLLRQLAEWRSEGNTERPCRATKVIPAVRLDEERPRLRPLKVAPTDLAVRVPIVVGPTAEVIHDLHPYSMPADAIGIAGTLYLYRDRVRIVAGRFVVMHERQFQPGEGSILPEHRAQHVAAVSGKLAALLDGRYVELGLTQADVTINPFAQEPSPERLHFLHAFVRVLLEGSDSYRLSDLEDREVYEAVENLYVLERHQRRLFTLANLLPRALAARLHKWVEGGRYAAVFDNVEDTLTFDRLQVFDFEAMRAYQALLEPLLFYVLHRVTERIQDPVEIGTLKLCVMDEAWRFIQHPTLRAYVQEALKTWRKRNAAMILATQAIDDFASADLLRTVVESCPTKLLLANPALDRRQYADLFQMNQMELDLLSGLIPRQQILLKRPDLAKVLTLTVDPKSYWIYTNTPIDNERVSAMFREFGFEAGLDRLAASA
jgi:hypothetical protein